MESSLTTHFIDIPFIYTLDALLAVFLGSLIADKYKVFFSEREHLPTISFLARCHCLDDEFLILYSLIR